MKSRLILCGVVFIACLLPGEAYAWGPYAHLCFGQSVLCNLYQLTPAAAALLSSFPTDFLLGTAAADMVIAKNRTPFLHHCHNWQVDLSTISSVNNVNTESV